MVSDVKWGKDHNRLAVLCRGKLSSEYDLGHNGNVTEAHFITLGLQKGNRNYMGHYDNLQPWLSSF